MFCFVLFGWEDSEDSEKHAFLKFVCLVVFSLARLLAGLLDCALACLLACMRTRALVG
jgi:hypothetical protein